MARAKTTKKKAAPILADVLPEEVIVEAVADAPAPEAQDDKSTLKKVTLVTGALVLAFRAFKDVVLRKGVAEIIDISDKPGFVEYMHDQKAHGITIVVADLD